MSVCLPMRMTRKPRPQPACQSGSSQCTRCISRSVLPRRIWAPPAGPSRNCSIAKRARSFTDVRHVGGGGDAARVGERRGGAASVGQPARKAAREPRRRPDRGSATSVLVMPSGCSTWRGDVVGIGLAGGRRHDLAGERQREVRVLPSRLRREHRLLPGQALPELAPASGSRPPSSTGTAASRGSPEVWVMRCRMRDRRRVGVPARDVEPRQVARHGIVELQRARVAELEDRRRGEELGDGGDAVERVRRGGRVPGGIRLAEPRRPHELLVVHDPDRHRGQPAIGPLRFDPGGEELEHRPDLRPRRERSGGRHGPVSRRLVLVGIGPPYPDSSPPSRGRDYAIMGGREALHARDDELARSASAPCCARPTTGGPASRRPRGSATTSAFTPSTSSITCSPFPIRPATSSSRGRR